MMKYALIFEPAYGEQDDLFTLLKEYESFEDIYFVQDVDKTEKVGGSIWFVMKSLRAALLTIKNMPLVVQQNIRGYHIVSYTDLTRMNI
jgi:hypothetical protein